MPPYPCERRCQTGDGQESDPLRLDPFEQRVVRTSLCGRGSCASRLGPGFSRRAPRARQTFRWRLGIALTQRALPEAVALLLETMRRMGRRLAAHDRGVADLGLLLLDRGDEQGRVAIDDQPRRRCGWVVLQANKRSCLYAPHLANAGTGVPWYDRAVVGNRKLQSDTRRESMDERCHRNGSASGHQTSLGEFPVSWALDGILPLRSGSTQRV